MINKLLIFIPGLLLLIVAASKTGQSVLPSDVMQLKPSRQVKLPVNVPPTHGDGSFSDFIGQGDLNHYMTPNITLANNREDIAAVGFAVDVSRLLALGLFNPASDQMNLVGEFTDWKLLPMEMAPDSSSALNYFTLMEMIYGDYQFKYVIRASDGAQLWEEGVNHFLEVNEPYVLPAPSPFNISAINDSQTRSMEAARLSN